MSDMDKKRYKAAESKLYPKTFLLPVVTIFVIFFIIPTMGGVLLSFTDWDITKSSIHFNGLYNYRTIFQDSIFKKAWSNTLIFLVSIVLIRNVLAVLLALAFTKNLKTRSYLRTIFFVPSILSYVVVGIMFNALFQMDGTFNQLLQLFHIACTKEWVASADTALKIVIVADIWKWTGFHMLIYIAGLTAIPKDFYEAALIDGANGWQRFWKVTAPLLVPAFSINITQSIIGGFRVFEQVLTLTNGGPGHETTVIGMLVYEYYGAGLYGKSSAITIILSVVVFIVTIFVKRFFNSREVEY